jgi:hypothetical protein
MRTPIQELENRRKAKAQLLAQLKLCAETSDTESGHSDADDALLAFINDKEITAAYNAVPKWYA